MRILSHSTRTALLSYNVLNNDSFEGSTPTITAVGSPSNGTVTIDGDGTAGNSHTHQLQTSTALTPSPTPSHPAVSLKQPPSTSPSTNRTTGTFTGDTDSSGDEDGGNITGTLNFTDTADGDSNNFTVNTGPSNGTATINATTGAWSYSPNADFNGSDSFTVQVTDDDNNTETQVISLTVNGVDDIVADSFSLNEDGSLSYNVLNNDSFEGSTPTITAVGSPSNGTVTIDGDGTAGTLTYTPTSNFNGSDSFTYTVTSGGVTETASVNVTVNQQNDPGTFTGDTDGSGDEDGGNITGTLNFTDTTDGDSNPNFTVNTGPSNGTATINATTGAWSYSPNADFNGSDSFTVQVTDDDNNTETQVISLTVNGVDDIVADSFSLNEDGSLSYNVLNNDSFEGSTPTITAVGSPSNGTVTIDGDGTAGTLTYTPTSNFNGSDSFTYTVTSGGVTETASVNVTVNQQNDPGTFTGDTDGSGDEDGGNITGTLNFTDTTDGDSNPNFTVNTGPSNGTATINATTGAWSYSPNADFNGSDSFTVQVTDDDNNTETQVISLTVNGVDDIVADSFSLNEDGSLSYNVLNNDSFEGSTPTITAVGSPSNGTVTIDGDTHQLQTLQRHRWHAHIHTNFKLQRL